MDTLFRKNLYQVAIDMAENDDSLSPNTLVELYREYGDHLYEYALLFALISFILFHSFILYLFI
jgi:hypothetical protein